MTIADIVSAFRKAADAARKDSEASLISSDLKAYNRGMATAMDFAADTLEAQLNQHPVQIEEQTEIQKQE